MVDIPNLVVSGFIPGGSPFNWVFECPVHKKHCLHYFIHYTANFVKSSKWRIRYLDPRRNAMNT